MKLPNCHDSEIIGVSNKNRDLVINIELDSAFEPNKELLTLYLKNCMRSKYWYNVIKKYAVSGYLYHRHFHSPNSIDSIKLNRNELIIYLHYNGSFFYKSFRGKLVKLPLPPQNRVVRIRFESLKIN